MEYGTENAQSRRFLDLNLDPLGAVARCRDAGTGARADALARMSLTLGRTYELTAKDMT